MAEAGVAVVRPFMKDPVDKGFLSALFAATSGRVGDEQINGVYVVPECKVTGAEQPCQGRGAAQAAVGCVEGEAGRCAKFERASIDEGIADIRRVILDYKLRAGV